MMSNVQKITNNKEVQDYLENLGSDKGNYRTLYLSVQVLKGSLFGQKGFSAIQDILEPLAEDESCKLFSLPNTDLLLFFRKDVQDKVSSVLSRIKFLLHEDEKFRSISTLEEGGIVFWYDLDEDYEKLIRQVEKAVLEENSLKKSSSFSDKSSFFNTTSQHFKEKLTTEMLAKVQKIISVSDFSSFIRRQSVCAIIGKSAPQRVFEEVFVSIPDMRDSLLPDTDLTANPWLFLALTETLDRRVLEIISRHDDGSLSGNFSVNINVSTILSDEFLRFDDTINGSMRQTIVLELQLVDIFSDIRSFILAKTFAKARGYRICIDGITVDKLKYLNRSGLDCDLMKIVWHPSLVDILNADEHFMDYMNKAERAKIILCRIDNPKAIEEGNALGINFYQGRYVQSLLNSSNTKR